MSCEDILREGMDKLFEALRQRGISYDDTLAITALVESTLRDYCGCIALRKAASNALESIFTNEVP